MDYSAKRKIAKQHVGQRLGTRLRIFSIIITVIVGIGAYNVLSNQISASLAVGGLVLGIPLGFVVGRMYKIFWHTDTQKVVSTMDKLGIFFLAAYIIIDLSRKWFFSHWLQGAQLNAFTLVFLAGLMLGRLLTIIRNIKKVLREEDKI